MQNNVAVFTPEQRLKMLREWIAGHKREAARLHRGNPKAKVAAEADADRMDEYAVSLLNDHRPGMPAAHDRVWEIEQFMARADYYPSRQEYVEAIVAADPLTKWVRGK